MRHKSFNEDVQVTHPIDIEIGRRIRHRRWRIGMSQQDLGKLAGVSFQQIQKYEIGRNRVSASKLWVISRALSIPTSYFFDGIEESGQFETLLST